MAAVRLLKVAAGLIWIYSYATLGVMLAIAALPGFWLAIWGWGLDVMPASRWGSVLDPLVGIYFSILGFFLFGITLMFVLPGVRLLFLLLTGFKLRPHVGAIAVHSFAIFPWYNENGMQFMFNTVFGRFARLT